MTKHFDVVLYKKKGFHHLPSYKQDVMKVAKVLLGIDVLKGTPGLVYLQDEYCEVKKRNLSKLRHAHQQNM